MRNVSFMHAIARISGAKFIVFLQPSYAIGFTKENLDAERIAHNPQDTPNPAMTSYEYLEEINYLYRDLSRKCLELKFCIDISRIDSMNADPYLYTDPRHFNSKGNKKVAEFISDCVQNMISNESHKCNEIENPI